MNQVQALLKKQIIQLRNDIERSMSPEDLKNSQWIVYGENIVEPLADRGERE